MAGIALGLGIFCSRDPVLIVTDMPFTALYGVWRTRIRTIESALILFRPVKPVRVAENAGPDMVAFAVAAAAETPYCVLFPSWYSEGAGRYAEQVPHVPAVVLGGRNRDPQVKGVVFVGTDWETDLYRAGLCAGILARHEGDKGVAFFEDEELTGEQREAFRGGLREGGFENAPQYLRITETDSDNKDISCAVMQGADLSFFDQNEGASIILFSWIDPGLTAGAVKVVFDDAPWALAPRVVKMVTGNDSGGLVPSEIWFLGRRIGEKELVRDLKKVLDNERAHNKKNVAKLDKDIILY